MKFKVIIFLGSFVLMSSTSTEYNECLNRNFVFQDGEQLEFKVYYNWKAVWIGAGKVNFDLNETQIDGKTYLHSKVEGKTLRKYDLFYKVRDYYESFIDPHSLMSAKFERDVFEGGYTIYNKYDFDHHEDKLIAEYEDYKTPWKRDTFDLLPCTHDVLSAIYYLRCYDLTGFKTGDSVPLRVFIDNKYYDLEVTYQGKEIIKTKLGKFRCIKVSPTLISGRIFDDSKAMTIYVTDDDNRLPILIESPISVGSVKALLVGYKGVRNPLTAKL